MRPLLILGWHNLTPTPAAPLTGGDGPRSFARQVRTLLARLNPVSLPEALGTLRAGGRLPRGAVALTFDDGYRDNAEVAAPVLRSLGVPATFFLVPGFLDRRVDPWWEAIARALSVPAAGRDDIAGGRVPEDPALRRRAATGAIRELKGLPAAVRDERVALARADAGLEAGQCSRDLMMDWADAAALVADGFSIGAHTDTHPILAREDPADQRRELGESRRLLEERLGVPVRLGAYPNGGAADVSAATLAAAREAGLHHAVTTVWGLNTRRTHPLALRRVLVSPTRTLRNLRWDASDRPWRPVRGA